MPEPDPFQRRERRAARLLWRVSPQHQRQFHVLGHAQDRQQVKRLEDEAHQAGALGRPLRFREPVDILPLHLDRARIHVIQAGEAVEQRRLARPGRAYDRDVRAARNLQVHVFQSPDLTPTRPVDLAHPAPHQYL